MANLDKLDKKEVIKKIVKDSVASFASRFQARHEGEFENPNGTINMKIHNVFISTLDPNLQYYSALVRSFDSSIGNMLEDLAIKIAKLSYTVKREVKGSLSLKQTSQIAELLEKYKSREISPPKICHYQFLRTKQPMDNNSSTKRHKSDYYLNR